MDIVLRVPILLDKDGLPLRLQDPHQFFDLTDGVLLSLIFVHIRQRLEYRLDVSHLLMDNCIDFLLAAFAVASDAVPGRVPADEEQSVEVVKMVL